MESKKKPEEEFGEDKEYLGTSEEYMKSYPKNPKEAEGEHRAAEGYEKFEKELAEDKEYLGTSEPKKQKQEPMMEKGKKKEAESH